LLDLGELNAGDMEQAFFVLAAELSQREGNRNLDPHLVARSLLERERIGSTLVAPGIALPHCRLRSLLEPVVAVVSFPEGVSFGSSGDLLQTVELAVVVLSPEKDTRQHLLILARIAGVLKRWLETDPKAFRQRVKQLVSELQKELDERG
jgi:mannitol/fructose-specific phosphotransferase system IIA component (Ntr-type)